jgi:SAM-dependent methyltransferase
VAGRTFDALAPVYRAIEFAAFGRNLHRCRAALLPRVADRRRVLILGEGDGRFLADFLPACPLAEAEVCDISPGMVARARRRVGENPRVRFRTGDARTLDFPLAGFDLIVTNFFLDCFPHGQLAPLVEKLAAALAPGGLWIVGDFRLPEVGRARSKWKLAVMYAFFRLATRLPAAALADPNPVLRANGLECREERKWQGGFLSAALWQKSVRCRVPGA